MVEEVQITDHFKAVMTKLDEMDSRMKKVESWIDKVEKETAEKPAEETKEKKSNLF